MPTKLDQFIATHYPAPSPESVRVEFVLPENHSETLIVVHGFDALVKEVEELRAWEKYARSFISELSTERDALRTQVSDLKQTLEKAYEEGYAAGSNNSSTQG